jgi:hypothetical protein
MRFRTWWFSGAALGFFSGHALAEEPPAPTAGPLVPIHSTKENLPPKIELWPARYNQAEIVARVGRKLELNLEVSDAEGAPLSVSALGLPDGAKFSEELRALRWTPAPAQRGAHLLRFVASDGVKQTSRTLHIEVTDNRPPRFNPGEHKLYAERLGSVAFVASDPDGDPLRYSIQGAPRGASFDATNGNLSFRPSSDDIGEHRVRVSASDGELSTTAEFTLEVLSARGSSGEEWQSYLLPGIGYAIYAPRARDTTGTFQGLSLELLIGAWIHRNENRGPSHGRVYLSAEILDSTDDGVPVLFTYAFGFSLSLERNPRRSFVIPNYGLDLGQIVHDDFGARFHATPYFGIHLFSSPNIFLSTRLGYRLVPSDLEHLGGLHAGLNFDFSIW